MSNFYKDLKVGDVLYHVKTSKEVTIESFFFKYKDLMRIKLKDDPTEYYSNFFHLFFKKTRSGLTCYNLYKVAGYPFGNEHSHWSVIQKGIAIYDFDTQIRVKFFKYNKKTPVKWTDGFYPENTVKVSVHAPLTVFEMLDCAIGPVGDYVQNLLKNIVRNSFK